ncbi:MAG: HEPN domain-containing protein [Nitrospinae bacterium]|nr:HEPN domain-containing protein [Nitrospinota bacterium]
MASRADDWYRQAKRDLQHARHALEDEEFEWACFAAQQAAEKALKALYQTVSAEAWGHSVFALLENLPQELSAEEALKDVARELDKHYIPPRYPNSYPQGAPYEYYTRAEAERAIAHAERILAFCQDHLSRQRGGPGTSQGSGGGADPPPAGD